MAINSLLVATGSATLCLHDHNFGHLVTSEHSEDGDDCHSSEMASEHTYTHNDGPNNFLEEAAHCFDIVMESSDEPVRRITELAPVKKSINYTISYTRFEPTRKVFPAVELRFVTRAPPISCGALDQCVRKTVFRI